MSVQDLSSAIFLESTLGANLSLISVLTNNPKKERFIFPQSNLDHVGRDDFSFIGSPLALKIGELTGNEALGYQALAGIMGLVFSSVTGQYSNLQMVMKKQVSRHRPAQQKLTKFQSEIC